MRSAEWPRLATDRRIKTAAKNPNTRKEEEEEEEVRKEEEEETWSTRVAEDLPHSLCSNRKGLYPRLILLAPALANRTQDNKCPTMTNMITEL